MSDLQKLLRKIYDEISRFGVSGDMIDVMAGIREDLRQAYKMAEEVKPDGEQSDNGA